MDLSQYEPSGRYGGKARYYSRFRPSYPARAVEILRGEMGLSCRKVADIGAGTGVFSRQLLDAGLAVCAVEPNPDMRREAQMALSGYPGFVCINGTAEATTLPTASVDALSCAQAFHWFDVERVVPEFRRILRPGGVVCLIWNNQCFGLDAFHQDYETVLRRGCPDYEKFDLASVSYGVDKLRAQFATDDVRRYHFDNAQALDLNGLKGRISSVSYCPPEGSDDYVQLMEQVEALFRSHAHDDVVTIRYDVEMFCIRFAC